MTHRLTLVLCGLCAPPLAYGQVAAGGGLQQEFWHLQLYSGDRVTFLADLGSNPEYGPRE